MAKVNDDSKITLNAAGWMWLGCLELTQQDNALASVFWLTLECWKHEEEVEISFFPPFFGSKTANFISPTFASCQSQIQGCSHSCHSEIRPREQSKSKELHSQLCSCPWDCPQVWSRDICLPRPSCHCSPWTAGHKVISLHSRCFTVSIRPSYGHL